MEDLRSYPSVARWIENVDRYYRLSDVEWQGRLEALRRFCDRVGRDPDAMIRDALERKEEKIGLMRRLRQVAREIHDDPRAAHDWDNVVRSFFIHNGARVVVRPYEE